MNWEELFSNKDYSDLKLVKKYVQKYVGNISFKIIHVVGTNGKGSVSNYIAQGLQSKDLMVGLFTSPHLVKPNERIKINQIQISDTDFQNIIEHWPKMHFFTLMYLVALKWFQEKNVDYAIIEAGIGGALDTINAIHGDYGIVTSIGLDHQKLLGNTRSEIAKQKAGIITQNMKFYIPSFIDKELQIIFIKKTKNSIILDNEGETFVERNKKLALGFLNNAFKIKKVAFKNPMGRVDIINYKNKNIIIDVAHNMDGVRELFTYLKLNQIHYTNIVFAFQKTKNIDSLKELLPLGKNIYYYKPSSSFHDFSKFKKIVNPLSLKGDTLLFGSFYFIGKIYEKIN